MSTTDAVIDNACESDPVHIHQHRGTGGHLHSTSHNVQLIGKLRVHEVTFDPTADLAHLSRYVGGFRVVSLGAAGLGLAGRLIDQGGNDFWDVQIHKTADGERLILASDRDSGLYVFRYTGPRP